MRGLVRAMHKYHDAHASLPPAVVPNPALPPERRLSGFVLLLPFLDATDFPNDGNEGPRFFDRELSAMAKTLHETIDIQKAWDDPVNLKAARTVVPAFLAPGNPFRDKNGYAVSHFAFVRGAVGKDDGAFNDTVGVTFVNAAEVIADGSVNTLALGQINDELGPWTAAGFSTGRHAYHPSGAFTCRRSVAAMMAAATLSTAIATLISSTLLGLELTTSTHSQLGLEANWLIHPRSRALRPRWSGDLPGDAGGQLIG